MLGTVSPSNGDAADQHDSASPSEIASPASRSGTENRADPFSDVLGARRGSGRPDPAGDAALHRDVSADGTTTYHRYPGGPLHRDDGPAVEHADGGPHEWYRDGELHRDDGPAIEFDGGGTRCWFRDGRLHREDGPAVEYESGKEWWREGKRHRRSGPAVERQDGRGEWWRDGRGVAPPKSADSSVVRTTETGRPEHSSPHFFDDDEVCVHCGALLDYEGGRGVGCDADSIEGNEPGYTGFARTPREMAAGVTSESKILEVFSDGESLPAEEAYRRLRDFNRRFYPDSP